MEPIAKAERAGELRKTAVRPVQIEADHHRMRVWLGPAKLGEGAQKSRVILLRMVAANGADKHPVGGQAQFASQARTSLRIRAKDIDINTIGNVATSPEPESELLMPLMTNI